MTTWASSIRHPWFNPPTMKRKLFSANQGDDASYSSDASPAVFTPSSRKRVRYDTLERTLAHMTLGNALASEGVDMWPKISPPRPRERETLNVILPSSVEEPVTVASQLDDMDMEVDSTTPEVSTDTTKTSAGLRDWEKQLDIQEVQISPAVLACLQKQSKYPPAPILLFPQTSQALVLYRAPRPPAPESLEPTHDEEEEKSMRTSILVAHEEDVMEVE